MSESSLFSFDGLFSFYFTPDPYGGIETKSSDLSRPRETIYVSTWRNSKMAGLLYGLSDPHASC